jgi:hypothetical protein
MIVINPELVIVKGVDHIVDNNLCHLFDSFLIDNTGLPKEDAHYVAMYKNSLTPDIAITHIGLVDEIVKDEYSVDYYYKAIIHLKEPVFLDQVPEPIEYWNLSDLQLDIKEMNKLVQILKSF